MKLSIGNLPQSLSEKDLETLFLEFGSPESISIKRDKKTGTSLGYGSIEMEDSAALKAIEKLNGKEIQEKKIVVVDSATLMNTKHSDKNKDKNIGSSKYHGSQTAENSSISTPRRSGGGGRGK